MPSLRTRFMLFGLVLSALSAPGVAQDAPTPESLWLDFNHYVLIAREDLAAAAATKLLEVDEQALLDVVEAGGYQDWEKRTLPRALGMASVQQVAQQLANKVQSARISRMREGDRIRADIENLSKGRRPSLNATIRLRAAGQFAAPQLLGVLLDEKKAAQHPYIMNAMIAIGEPLVYPLAESISALDGVPMRHVARVLAEIGYPRPLPYLREVLERQGLESSGRASVQAAYDRLAASAGVQSDVGAAELFFQQSWAFYQKATSGQKIPGHDAATGKGIIWHYSEVAGLIEVPVPGPIFGDVLAMRAAQRALLLDPTMDKALSLWLAANLRRENRLPDGEVDPSYGQDRRPAAFYLTLAGPLRQHDVLGRALADNDPELALDAIDALSDTAGAAVLLNLEGREQPLLTALSYPDRRVRWKAAQALTNARPRDPFPGSFRVVPVLSESIRQSGDRRALVIAADPQDLARLTSAVRELGYKVDSAAALEELQAVVSGGPGIDLLVTALDARANKELYAATEQDRKLALVPIVAVVDATDLVELERVAETYPRLLSTPSTADSLQEPIAAATASLAGAAMGDDESLEFALTALNLLKEIAVSQNDVFRVADARPVVIEALKDSREPVVQEAASVLALIDDSESQRAIAGLALDGSRSEALRISALESLAESAKAFGNNLDPTQLAALLELVKTSQGQTAQTAARAHGALTPPTRALVEMVKE